MKVRVTNFGPIEDAEFELGDVTVVIGPNASGKSFLSYMLYSVLGTIPLTSPEDLEELPRGEAYLSSYLDVINKVLARSLRKGFEDVFGVKYRELISVGHEESRITFTDEGIGDLTITLGKEFEVETKLHKDVKLFVTFEESEGWIPFTISVKTTRTDTGDYRISLHYSPAGSPGKEDVLEAGKKEALASALVELILRLLLREYSPVEVKMLPTERNLVISNLLGYLSAYISANRLLKVSDKPVVRYFVESLMGAMTLLKGEEVSIPTFNLKCKIVEPFVLEVYEKGERIPLPLLSSGYAQVLPVHILSRFGRFLIIEEPELNLHAGAQVKVANYLYDLVEKEDKRLFLTTHSDIFAIQMTINHVKRGRDKGKTLKIYLLNEGRMEEIAYTERGDIESIPTITDVIREQVKEIYGE